MMTTVEKSPGYGQSVPVGSVVSIEQSGHAPPSIHNTTIDPNPGVFVTEINLNLAYFKTLPGITKLVQLVFGIICMACGSPAREYVGETFGVGHNHWFLFVVSTSFIITLLWCFFYLLQLGEAIAIKLPFSWLKLEYIFTICATIMYFIAFIVLLAGFGYCAGESKKCDARIAAGVFGIFNTFAYGFGAYIIHTNSNGKPTGIQ